MAHAGDLQWRPGLAERVRVQGSQGSFFVMAVAEEMRTADLVTSSGPSRCVEAVPFGELVRAEEFGSKERSGLPS